MTKEIESFEIVWVKAIHIKIQDRPQFKDDEKLNLQLDESRVALQVTTQSTFCQMHRWAKNWLHILT